MKLPLSLNRLHSFLTPTVVLLFFIWLLGVAIRFHSISGQSINLWYDQARDIQTVRDMLTNHDLKIQGPSASGTNDTIYHGVFYYYLITPAVLIGNGSPIVVSYYLAMLGSISILISYALIQTVFRSRSAGLVTALFFAIGLVPTHYSTWLSNPQILLPTTGAFYYFLWKICFDKAHRWEYIGLGISLGLAVHGGIFQLYLGGTLLLAVGYLFWRKTRISTTQAYDFILAASAFLVTISPIILTHLLLIHRGILTFSTLSSLSSGGIPSWQVFTGTLELYWKTFQNILTPDSIPLIFGLVLLTGISAWRTLSSAQKVWVSLVITAPLWLLFVQFRTSSHMLIGIEYVVYGLVALTLTTWWQTHLPGKIAAASIFALLVFSNVSSIQTWQAQRHHYGVIQKGAALHEQLATIDATYQEAAGQPFSISTLTSPYSINITWGYLYDWYGKQKYGYVPELFANAQVDLIGENLLPHVTTAQPIHFTIIEPDTALPMVTILNFNHAQDELVGTPSAEKSFGSIRLQSR